MQGRPFVGDAGQVLDKVLTGVGFRREDFSFSNVLKCRPPKNKFELGGAGAVKACSAALDGEINRAKPPVLVAIGQRALDRISPAKGSISLMRGQPFMSKYGIPAIATYHPAYFRRSNDERIFNAIWDDLSKLKGSRGANTTATTSEGGQAQVAFKLLSNKQAANLRLSEFVLDIEGPFEGELLCIGISQLHGKGMVCPGQMYVYGSRMIGHFARYDYTELRKRDLISDDIILEDTIPLLQLLDENRESYALKSFAQDYGFPIYWDARGEMEQGIRPEKEKLHQYCAIDVELTKRIYLKARSQLKEDPELNRYYENFLVPAVKLCAEVELNGAQVSPDAPQAMKRLMRRVKRRKKIILGEVGIDDPDFKLTGTLFKQDLFFNKLKLKPAGYTDKKKQPALNKYTMPKLEEQDTTGLVKKYREIGELLQQEQEFKKLINAAGSLMHARFNLGGRGRKDDEKGSPVTGRTSSQEPNMQNFPDWVRKYFISRWKKGVLLKWDASQIELRTAFCYSGDSALIQPDRHGLTAKLFTKIVGLSAGQRRKFTYEEGKTGNFAVIFGAEVKKLMREFGLDEEEAVGILHALRDEFPLHFDYVNKLKQELRRTGQVRSLTGRIRRLPLAQTNSKYTYHAINQGINYPIQSLANDLNLMCALWLKPRGAIGRRHITHTSTGEPSGQWYLWNLVHDEGDIDCESRRVALDLVDRIKHYWSKVLPKDFENKFGVTLPTTFEVKISMGENWLDMEEVA